MLACPSTEKHRSSTTVTQSSDPNVIWLTQEAFDKLQHELEHLRGPVRQQIIERISAAREEGDLKENGGYHAAREEQGKTEARIRQLKHLLSSAEVREAEDTGRVEVGSLVAVVDQAGEEMEYFVATPENKVAGHLLASPAGPLGRALLGARAGDELTYEAPGGSYTIKVKSVRPYRG